MPDLLELRSVLLLPPALFLLVVARSWVTSWRAVAAAVFVGLAGAWLATGAGVRSADSTGSWLIALHAAMHDRVWLPALGVSVVGFLTFASDRRQ